jgi:hypothetical protein
VSSIQLWLKTMFSLLSDIFGFVAFSDEMKNLPFAIAAGPRQLSYPRF